MNPEARTGSVTAFDEGAGYGELTDPDGARWWFHCTAIADGSRNVAVGSSVRFRLAPGHLGRYEGVEIQPA